ncbi:hypothetical protein CBL_07770 [Carabus blaptoides fortunei]
MSDTCQCISGQTIIYKDQGSSIKLREEIISANNTFITSGVMQLKQYTIITNIRGAPMDDATLCALLTLTHMRAPDWPAAPLGCSLFVWKLKWRKVTPTLQLSDV